MSDFDSLVSAHRHGYAVAGPPAGRQLPEGSGIPGRSRRLLRPARRAAVRRNEINALEQTPDWSSTAVVIAYDDSDGWYDHVYSGVHNPSNTASVATPPGPQDFLNGAGICGGTGHAARAGRTAAAATGRACRCWSISPWAKRELRRPHADRPELDHEVRRGQLAAWTDRRVVRRDRRSAEPMFDFGGSRPGNSALYLDPTTGQPVDGELGAGLGSGLGGVLGRLGAGR